MGKTWPTGAEQGKTEPNGVKRRKAGPTRATRAKLGKIWPNTPTGAKKCQTGLILAKTWPNRVNLDQTEPSNENGVKRG